MFYTKGGSCLDHCLQDIIHQTSDSQSVEWAPPGGLSFICREVLPVKLITFFLFFVFVGKMLLSNCIITTFISYILKLYSETGDKIWEPLL